MDWRAIVVAVAVSGSFALAGCASGERAAPDDHTSPAPRPAPSPAPSPKPSKPGPAKRLPLPKVGKAEAAIVHTAPKPEPPAGVPCGATADACVDLSANQAWLLGNGKILYGPTPITSGRPGYETPPGTFHVQWKDIDHLSREFDYAPMPYSVFFNGGIAFHEGSLSVPSHGCVHLSAAAARAFFDGLRVGDVVQVVS